MKILYTNAEVTNGTFIQLSISDSGTGIASTVKDKILIHISQQKRSVRVLICLLFCRDTLYRNVRGYYWQC